MVSRLSAALLSAFRRLPAQGSVRADSLGLASGRSERLRLARRLEQEGLVETVARRPKTIGVRRMPFPRALHAALRDKRHLEEVLRDHGALVLGVLATSPNALPASEVARLANLHENTVYPILRRLGRRAFLAKARAEYALHGEAGDAARLGRLYLEHAQMPIQANYPTAFPVHQHYGRLIVEAPGPLAGLPVTAATYFQHQGADVLAKAHAHAVIVSGARLTRHDAFEDFLATRPPPRTRAAVEAFMKRRRRRA